MGNIGYSATDVIVTDFLYRNMKKTELEHKIAKLKEQRELCDDIAMQDILTNKIIRLKNELKSL